MLYGGPSAESSALNLNATSSDYERRVGAFNQKRAWKGVYQSRVSSWSDPVSAREVLDGEEERREDSGSDTRRTRGAAGARSHLGEASEAPVDDYFGAAASPERRLMAEGPRR